ncbi:MAG: hypothetical protein QM709_12750 [Spongiibacteraceae bacterium]
MALSISMKSASQELADSAITKAITMLAATVAKAKNPINTDNKLISGLPNGPALDVTFMLPGKLEKPAFSGMRMGGYEAKAKTLYFEIAVPEHILHSAQSHVYAATALQDVVANANDFFCDNELHFNVLRWQQFVNDILATTTPA